MSVVTEPRRGQRVEAATVGREGVGSVHSALGSRLAGQELVGQVLENSSTSTAITSPLGETGGPQTSLSIGLCAMHVTTSPYPRL